MRSGGEVELLADEDRPGGWLLLLDRVRQSYVDLNDPTYLEFPYLQAFAEVIAELPNGPLEVVHIGGGGATLARWVAATRAGSQQLVFEPNEELLLTVQRRLPVANVEFDLQDGRSGLALCEMSSADVIVVDAFSGARVPAELSTGEFFADVARVLRPNGIVLMNTTDGPPFAYLRRLVAALSKYFPELVMEREPIAHIGNTVLFAARPGVLPANLVLGDSGSLGPVVALSGAALDEFIGDATPLVDGDSLRSPAPPDETWRVGGDF